MTHAPGDHADRGVSADVSQITDEEWLAGHRVLVGLGIPAGELAYLYDPGRDPATVTVGELTPDRDPAEPDEATEAGRDA